MVRCAIKRVDGHNAHCKKDTHKNNHAGYETRSSVSQY